MSHPAETDIVQLIEEIAPENLLVIDLKEPHSLELHLRRHPQWKVRRIHGGDLLEEIASSGQHDVAVVCNTLEYLEKTQAGIVISRLRDLYSRRLLALVSVTPDQTRDSVQSKWQDAELIAFGMTQLATYPDGRHLYEYNILSYKNVPDWLNAKNWANPELWDKYRW